MAGSSTGWGHRALGEVAEVNPETLGAATPAGQEFRYVDLSAVDRGRIDWSSVSKTTFRSAPSRARRVVRGGDVLFGTVRPSLQSHGAIPAGWADHVVASTGFAVIRAKEGMATARFLFHWVLSPSVTALARRAEVGSNYPAVNESDIARFVVHAPPIEEQRRIAEVLDTLDEATQKTEQVIAKLKQLKQGLLHDLLTRGIDENGELRDPERHPEQFKSSELGRIPDTWTVGGLMDVPSSVRQPILTGPFGAQLGAADFTSEGVPLLRIGNVQWGWLDLADLLHVSVKKAAALARYAVEEGDLLFARQGATTGRNALADERVGGALINYHIIRVAVDPAKCMPTFLYSMFNSPIVQRQVDSEKGRSTREGVSTKTLVALRLLLPPIREQERIATQIEAFDARVRAEESLRNKLRSLKVGLMEDLLSGSVRVTGLAARGAA